jgi:hypothetical protein
MQIVENTAYVRNRSRIGSITHLGSMGLLAVGFVLSLAMEQLGTWTIFVSYVALILAMLLLTYGRTYTRRWGARFRQDQWIIPGLRGLDNRHTLFNFASAKLPDHIVLGPTGLYVILPRSNGGDISFNGRVWARGKGGFGALRFLSEGGLGNPIAEVNEAMAKLANYLQTNGSPELIRELEARPIIVFTNPKAHLEVKSSPIPVVQVKELKGVFRRAKATLSPEKVEELRVVLSREAQP